MKLNELSKNTGALQSRKRIGRGIGSGTGKTAGRGHKGQKSRTGVAIKGFEGGQMPLHRRLPKRGFNPLVRKDFAILNLGNLQAAITSGKLKNDADITETLLIESGVISKARDGVKLLNRGELKDTVSLVVTQASAAAIKAVEKAKGKVELSK